MTEAKEEIKNFKRQNIELVSRLEVLSLQDSESSKTSLDSLRGSLREILQVQAFLSY